jgi:hypothetical protein
MSSPVHKPDVGRGRAAEPASVRAAEPDISLEEREEILAQIEQTVARSRTSLGPDGLRYTSERSGVALPLIVNAVAILLIAGAAFLFARYSDREEQVITAPRAAGLIAGEGRIVGTIRRESEEKLAGKDQEISSIQGRLSQIDSELKGLRAQSAAKIREREEALRTALSAELEAERDRLARQGASAASADRQVKALEERKNRELDSALAAFRRQADAELAAREAEANALFDEYQKSLEQARAERDTLEKEMASQRTELLEKAQGDTAELQAALGSLREQARREELVASQIATAYRDVEAKVRASSWDEATAALDGLSAYLDAPAVSSLPAVQRRKPVELFIVDSLKDLIASRRGGTTVPAGAASAAEAAALVDRAEASYRAGDLAAARQAYAAAVRTFPELKTVPDRLAAIEDADWASTRKVVTEAIAAGDAAWTGGNWKVALDRYGSAFESLRVVSTALPRTGVRTADAGWRQGFADLVAREDRAARPLLDRADGLAKAGRWADALPVYVSLLRGYPHSGLGPQAVAGIEKSVDGLLGARDAQAAEKERGLSAAQKQEAEKQKAAAEERIRAVSDGLSASVRRASGSAAASQKELIELLEAKVKMKEVLGSPAVEAQYPGLAGKLDRFLDLFAEEKKAEARAATLRDVGAVVDYLGARRPKEEVLPLLDRYATEAGRSSFQQLLDRLRGLFD